MVEVAYIGNEQDSGGSKIRNDSVNPRTVFVVKKDLRSSGERRQLWLASVFFLDTL